MIQTSLIDSTLEKYRKLKNFDAEIDKLRQELATYCINYIKSYYPENIFTLLAKGSKSMIPQRDIDFWYRDVSVLPGLDSSIISTASEFFYSKIRKIPMSSHKLPLFFTAEDIICGTEECKNFREKFPEFTKTFIEKYTALVLFAYDCAKRLRMLRTVLANQEATLTSIKENYIELYNLIKS